MSVKGPNSTDSKQGGRLFDLPLEIRNEVYRYVVKGSYVDRGPPASKPRGIYRVSLYPRLIGLRTADLAILCVSKVVSDEAMTMLYSESKFQIEFMFRKEEAIWFSSRVALDHVMNIEIHFMSYSVRPDVAGFPPDPCLRYLNNKQQIWKAFLSCLIRTNTVRNTFGIKCSFRFSDGQDPIPEWMYQCLKLLRRFRTVFVELESDSLPEIYRIMDTHVDPKPMIDMMEAMEKYLGHALGPGVVDSTYDRENHSKTLSLTFHPQEHMPAILRARAETLRNEADVLDLEANKAEGQNISPRPLHG